MKELSTDNFLLFENGVIMDNDSLIHLLKRDPSIKIKYELEFIREAVCDDLGTVVYFNRGNFFRNDSLIRDVTWLESATIRNYKVNGDWTFYILL